MAETSSTNAAIWLEKARKFYALKNWVGALSSVRNTLRLDVGNLQAWALGSDILVQQDRWSHAGRYAKALRRFALKAGAREEVEFAQRRMAEVDKYFANYHKLWGETDLTHFAAKGDMNKVRELLESGVDPNERNRTGWTALHCVAQRGNGEMARLLCDHGADLEATDSLEETPLIKACTFGNKLIVPVLIELRANVRHVAKEKHTALWYAISSMKDIETVRLLIESGANANETYEYGDNPFLLAVQAQKSDVVSYLLPLTKDVQRVNKHEVCALHFAASYDDIELLNALLARGVDIDYQTSWGATALMDAAQNGRLAAVQYLLSHGANANLKTESGETALSIAEHFSRNEIIALLS